MSAARLPAAAHSMKSLPHPAVLIFTWAALTIVMQSLAAPLLFLAGVPAVLCASLVSAELFRTLMRRTRFIMLSLLIIYGYATPGAAVIASLGQMSPTFEGLLDGVLQLARLVFALAGLAVLLGLLTQQQLIGGLYVLAHPLRYLGISRERAAVRLALTLRYAETAMSETARHWHAAVENMLAPVENAGDSVEVHVAPFSVRDGLWVMLCVVLLVLVWR